MRQRADLIHQIRAIETNQGDRWKPIDLTKVAGHGVHDEMSIVELRERLEIVKLERERERQSRRDQIIRDKQEKETFLTSTVQNIVKYRNELSSQAIKKFFDFCVEFSLKKNVFFSFDSENNDKSAHRRAKTN